jgi:hypothetical protein
MQPAMRNIVDVYVRLGNREALNELRASRERLIVGLKKFSGSYDPSKVIAQFADDIALIEAGLQSWTRRPRRKRGFGPAPLYVDPNRYPMDFAEPFRG